MVMASGRWLGARLDCLASLLVGAVALAAILVSQDAGKLKILSNVLVFLCKIRIYIVVNEHSINYYNKISLNEFYYQRVVYKHDRKTFYLFPPIERLPEPG